MKSMYLVFLCVGWMMAVIISYSQPSETLKSGLTDTPQDSNRVKLLLKLAESYYFNKPDTCLIIAQQALALARKINYTAGEVSALTNAGEAYRFLGDYPQALDMQFKALEINRKRGNERGKAISLGFIGLVYLELTEYRQGLNYLFQANEILNRFSIPVIHTFNISNIGNGYEGLNMLDSALYFQNQALSESAGLNHGNLKSLILRRLGNVNTQLKNYDQALQYYSDALQNALSIGDQVNPSIIQIGIAKLYLTLNKEDSSLYYVRLALANAQNLSQKSQILDASNLLVKLFRIKGKTDSALYYQDMAIAMKDNLLGPEKFRQLQLLTLHEQQQQQEILREQERVKTKTRLLVLGVMLVFFLIIALILYRNNRQKQKVNTILQNQKNEIEETLSILKSTQDQLVQREKMASLGELTAGIAHEIQNPLNFVNNFSEVNTELIDELQQEAEKENLREVKALAKDIRENEQKINHHGKRADSIVKAMMQHSQSNPGQKEYTDINKLADEYLHLSYQACLGRQGFRAKVPNESTGVLQTDHKPFDVQLKTDFDERIGRINIVPQDIGRVLLNVYNNAFYAVAERSKQIESSAHEKYLERMATTNEPSVTEPSTIQYYEPIVMVHTKRVNDTVEIRITDNGNGIPQKIIDKIFQPFFTTKPTGQGTGLGLSLAYDIIKGQRGEISVETQEGEGSTFCIVLPI